MKHSNMQNKAFYMGLVLVFLMSSLISLLVVLVILGKSEVAFNEINVLKVITDSMWHPLDHEYDLKPMFVGTLASSLGAVLLAFSIAVSIVVYINYYANDVLAMTIRGFAYITTSVPTVIYGFWGLSSVVPFLAEIRVPGVSLLAGIIILALMIVPTITLLIDIAVSKIPDNLIQGAFALGASRHRVCFLIALRLAKRGIVAAILIGFTRALGETIAVLMVTGNKTDVPSSLFDPVRTLTANVALEIGYAGMQHASVLFLSMLMLIALTAALSLFVFKLEKGSEFNA